MGIVKKKLPNRPFLIGILEAFSLIVGLSIFEIIYESDTKFVDYG